MKTRLLALALALAVGAYAILAPAGPLGGQEAGPHETPAAESSLTPATEARSDAWQPLEGLAGRFTYRTGGEHVAVQFPEAVELSRAPLESRRDERWTTPSADGEWTLAVECGEIAPCVLIFASPDDGTHELQTPYAENVFAAWAPAGHRLALAGTGPDGAELSFVDDPSSPELRVVASQQTTALAWHGEEEIIAAFDIGGASELRAIRVDGSGRSLATAAFVHHLYPSPDGETVAYTQDGEDGWRLHTINVASGELRDLGTMGSDGPGGVPVTSAPESKGPMAIAWSPDGSRLAFGGGFEPPYVMHAVDLRSGAHVTTEFERGYPGEIRWSPDGSRLAVSTYDIERTHHETWVVDPATGAGTHLMDGCVIVWSPDGRFLAVHGEDEPGIAIVDVVSGARAQLTRVSTDAPVAWSE
jgi:Tol biopolymer transport system component